MLTKKQLELTWEYEIVFHKYNNNNTIMSSLLTTTSIR